MTPATFRPTVEELNARVVPAASTVSPVAMTPVHTTPVPTPAAAHPLVGSGTGTYTMPVVPVDSGPIFKLAGTVRLNGLGEFTVTGFVRGTGSTYNGRATGQLVLSNARGTITLDLHGQVQPGFSPPPAEMVYVIRGGTGAYTQVKGYGVASAGITSPGAVRFTLS